MRTLILAIAMLMFASTAKAASISYEIKQPFECVVTKLSLPGVDKIITEKSGGVLISKDLQVGGVAWTKKDGWIVSLTYNTVIRRDCKLEFKETVFLKPNEVVTTTELVDDGGGRLSNYLLVTRIKRTGRTTVVEHDLTVGVDGQDRGIKVIIVGRISLRKAEAGIREVLGEPRPQRD